jgi:hypothetical protein
VGFFDCILLTEVDLLVPLSPDLGGSEHTTGTALVTERSLTSTVSTTTRDTRDTSDGTTCTHNKYVVKPPSQSLPIEQISTYRYPRTQRKSVHQPSRSRHKAVSCSWPYQCEPAYNHNVSPIIFSPPFPFITLLLPPVVSGLR